MASLLTLPDELLLLITTTLQHDKPTLCKLALASHRLHHIVREVIFRHAIPYFSAKGYPTLSQIRPASELLERSLSENATLRELVWSYGPITSFQANHEKDGMTMIKGLTSSWGEPQLLDSFPNLKKLYLMLKCEDSGCSAELLEDLSKGRHRNALRSITLLGNPCQRIVAACMALPHIQTVELNSVQFPSDCGVEQTGTRSNLRRLSLCNIDEPRTLRRPAWDMIVGQILTYCPYLEELRWDPNVTHAGLRLSRFRSMSSQLSPAGSLKTPDHSHSVIESRDQPFREIALEITQTLRPVAHSIKVLEVPAFSMRWFMDRSHSRSLPLDLTLLVALRRLDISAFFLLPATHPESTWKDMRNRDGMLKGLPSGLEHLRITLPTQTANVKDPIGAVYSHRYWCKDWSWMLQLPKAKVEGDLPRLRHVSLEEIPTGDKLVPTSSNTVTWEQPSDLQDVFNQADITVQVKVLVPDVRVGTTCST